MSNWWKYLDTFEKFMFSTIFLFMLLLAYTFIYAGFELSNSAKCLERGYPESKTTWNFQGYCINIEGDVTGVVEKL